MSTDGSGVGVSTRGPGDASAFAPTPFRTGRGRRWTALLVLAIGVGTYLLVLHTLVVTNNLNFFPTLLLIGSVTVPLSVLVLAWSVEPSDSLPGSTGLLVLSGIAGGLVGTLAAGTLEYDALRRLGTLPMIGVGLIEEAAKLVVPVILLLALRHPERQSGVLIGIASGAGFATLETMGYGFVEVARTRSLAALDQELLLRALLSPAGHVAWTGLTVAAVWRVRTVTQNRGRAILLAIGAYVAAVILHACWDGLSSVWSHAVVAVLSIAMLSVLIFRAGRQRRVRPTPG